MVPESSASIMWNSCFKPWICSGLIDRATTCQKLSTAPFSWKSRAKSAPLPGTFRDRPENGNSSAGVVCVQEFGVPMMCEPPLIKEAPPPPRFTVTGVSWDGEWII